MLRTECAYARCVIGGRKPSMAEQLLFGLLFLLARQSLLFFLYQLGDLFRRSRLGVRQAGLNGNGPERRPDCLGGLLQDLLTGRFLRLFGLWFSFFSCSHCFQAYDTAVS